MLTAGSGGKGFAPQKLVSQFGQPVVSKSTGEVLMLVSPPAASAAPVASADTPKQCAAALAKYCPSVKAQKDTCLTCLKGHPGKFFAGACTHSELSDYCDKTAPPCPRCAPKGPPPPPLPPVPHGQLLKPVFARELPQLSQQQLDDPACQGGTIRSKDGLDTFYDHKLINVSNSLGPHYIGGGLNHGIELQNGPHKGRFVLALRFDTACAKLPDYMRAYALFSDDQGVSWTAGQLLPAGWTEDQVAEMKNGSLLMTARLESRGFPQFSPDPNNGTEPRDIRRGFARSDDGGNTWAEIWHLADRQPEISDYVAECAHALTSDPETGVMWWAHPGGDDGNYAAQGGHDRYNGTLQRSDNGGASWELAAHLTPGIYPAGGYGYSDITLLRDGTVAVIYQKTFDPYDGSIEGGGYDLGLARVTA